MSPVTRAPLGRSRLELWTAERPWPLAEWAVEHRHELEQALARAGAVWLRGFDAPEPAFAELVGRWCTPLPYVYRSTPRTYTGGGVYTATEYPPAHEIPLHCENAYQRDWPLRLFLHCAVAPATGGETPLADVAAVTRALDPALVERFVERKVAYVRNYRLGVDLPWQTVFQTDDRAEVERYCDATGLEWEWRGEDALRTRQVCDAVAEHPRTGARLWFNQAHLFHVSALAPAVRRALAAVYPVDELPRHATHGDGTPIDEADLDAIRAAFAAEAVAIPWRAGDVVLVDNMAVAHGRRPFTGPRRVLVAMGDAWSAR